MESAPEEKVTSIPPNSSHHNNLEKDMQMAEVVTGSGSRQEPPFMSLYRLIFEKPKKSKKGKGMNSEKS